MVGRASCQKHRQLRMAGEGLSLANARELVGGMMADSYEFPVDRTQVMLFARSLLDINPVFWDPDDPATKAVGGIVTPPTFVQSSAHWEPDYALDLTRPRKNPRPARPAGEGGGGGGLGRGLHAEQHYEYHHPIHA